MKSSKSLTSASKEQSSPPKSPGSLYKNKALPVYSDFSHMSAANGGIGTVMFAVGLREENAEEMVKRVFPMTKIIPSPVKEKKIVKKVEKPVEVKPCVRPDCTARKEKLNNFQDENKHLRLKLKSLIDKIETSKNKMALTEKTIILTEEKNDVLNGNIEEAQSRIISIENDIEKIENFNQTLRKQLSGIHSEVEELKHEIEGENKQLIDLINEDKTIRRVFFSTENKYKNPNLAQEVSKLHFTIDDGDDSD